jgi:hypothetical protein
MAGETFDAKIGRSNAQPERMTALTKRRPGELDVLDGQSVMLLRKLPRRRGERKMKKDVNVGEDRRKRPRLDAKRKRMPSVLLDGPHVRKNRLIVKLLRPRKRNAPRGAVPGRPPSVKLMANLDPPIVDDRIWTPKVMKSGAEDVMNDAQHVTVTLLERAVASPPRLLTTISLLRVESTRTRRRIRRGRVRSPGGHTLGLIHGFRTILMPLHHQKTRPLSTTRLLRTERGAAEESRVDNRNTTM